MRIRFYAFAITMTAAAPAAAHPHVFIDGGIDFSFGPGQVLTSIAVTWRLDPFESLYILSANGMSLDADGGVSDTERVLLADMLRSWPDDFGGSAHLTAAGDKVALGAPADFRADLVEGRLVLTFTRDLVEPLAAAGELLEVSFHEATYFYDFSVTEPPTLHGESAGCHADLVPFEPDAADSALQSMLWSLGREETPEIANVGALFADWIFLTCD